MKYQHRVFLVFFLIFFWIFNINAQTRYSMLNEDYVWEVTHLMAGGINGTGYGVAHFYEQIETGKDLTTNGKNYKRFRHEYLREDTTKGLIYQLNIKDSSEFELYNWNLQLGDTFRDRRFDSAFIVVSSFDSVKIEGTWRKRLGFYGIGKNPKGEGGGMQSCHDQWIEGVGSTLGPLRDFGDCWHWQYRLFCLGYKTDKGKIPKAIYGRCNPMSIENETNTTLSFSIYPNPSNSGLITLTTNISEPTITIRNVIGELVFSNSYNSHFKELQLELPSTKGIYFIELKKGTETVGIKKVLRN